MSLWALLLGTSLAGNPNPETIEQLTQKTNKELTEVVAQVHEQTNKSTYDTTIDFTKEDKEKTSRAERIIKSLESYLGIKIEEQRKTYVYEGIGELSDTGIKMFQEELKKEFEEVIKKRKIKEEDKWIYVTLIAGYFREKISEELGKDVENTFIMENEDSREYMVAAEVSWSQIYNSMNNKLIASITEGKASIEETLNKFHQAYLNNPQDPQRKEDLEGAVIMLKQSIDRENEGKPIEKKEKYPKKLEELLQLLAKK